MTVNQMQYFVALCKCGSFSRASEFLFITQPALSKQISALESELNLLLVERKKGGKISITRSGEYYYQTFIKILNTLEQTELGIKFLSSKKQYVYRIGIMDGWMMQDYIRLCNEGISSISPDIEFHFEFHSPRVLNNLKDNNLLDYILMIDAGYNNSKSFIKQYITTIHSTLFAARNNPAVIENSIDYTKLDCLYILTEKETIHINMNKIESTFSSRPLVFKDAASISSIFINVLSGNAAAIGDEWSLPQFYDNFVSVRLSDAEVPVIFARREFTDPYSEQIWEFLQDNLQQWIKKTPEIFK